MAKTTASGRLPAKKKVGPKAAALLRNRKQVTGKKSKPSINLKYKDKSAGQPELLKLLEAIKKIARPYDGKNALIMHADTGGQFNLVSHKPVEIAGRMRKECWFISALVQKGYVGFYYIPVYMNDPLQKKLSPGFLQCLRGKACFHITKNDPALLKEIAKAIKLGYADYKKKGWL